MVRTSSRMLRWNSWPIRTSSSFRARARARVWASLSTPARRKSRSTRNRYQRVASSSPAASTRESGSDLTRATAARARARASLDARTNASGEPESREAAVMRSSCGEQLLAQTLIGGERRLQGDLVAFLDAAGADRIEGRFASSLEEMDDQHAALVAELPHRLARDQAAPDLDLGHHHQTAAHLEGVLDRGIERGHRQRGRGKRRGGKGLRVEALARLLHQIVVEQPHDHPDAGPQLPGIERDVEIGQVVVGSADDGAGVLDVRAFQRARRVDVVDLHRNAGGADDGDERLGLVAIDHHHRYAEAVQPLEDAEPDAPGAADDHVVLQGMREHGGPLLVVARFGEEEDCETDQAFGHGHQAERRDQHHQQLDRGIVGNFDGGLREHEEVRGHHGFREPHRLTSAGEEDVEPQPTARHQDQQHDEGEAEPFEQRPQVERLRLQRMAAWQQIHRAQESHAGRSLSTRYRPRRRCWATAASAAEGPSLSMRGAWSSTRRSSATSSARRDSSSAAASPPMVSWAAAISVADARNPSSRAQPASSARRSPASTSSLWTAGAVASSLRLRANEEGGGSRGRTGRPRAARAAFKTCRASSAFRSISRNRARQRGGTSSRTRGSVRSW